MYPISSFYGPVTITVCGEWTCYNRATPWTSYQIRHIAGCACVEICREPFPRHRRQRKPLVSDSGMHHATCVTHVPWCMSGSLTIGYGANVARIPGACAARNFAYLPRDPRNIWTDLIRKSSQYYVYGIWQYRVHSILCKNGLFERIKGITVLRMFHAETRWPSG